MDEKKYTNIGGQAIIEGVMMRSPHFLAIAVRKSDQSIVIKEQLWKGLGDRFPILKKPLLRGVLTLIESMINGIEALTYSANAASSTEDEKEELTGFAMFSSLFFAFAMGMGLFVVAPHYLTLFLSTKLELFQNGIAHPAFHLMDGTIKVIFLVTYIYAISLMKDIHRVFQYHGAEHKSIYAFEQGEELTIKNARKYTTLHPRCGTSFLLFLLIISVFTFSVLFPFFQQTPFSENVILNHAALILIKIALMLPVAGISYEFIRFSAQKMEHPILRYLIMPLMYPGLLLQKITTKEPSDDQLEVALISLKRVLFLEKNPDKISNSEITIRSIDEIAASNANLSEFLG